MRHVVTEQDIPPHGQLRVPKGAILTPMARDLARERGVEIVELDPRDLPGLAAPEKTIAMGADHGGFALKETLKSIVQEFGYFVRDVGIFEEKTADYPDIAHNVARLVAEGKAALGVVIDGAGIGSAIAANKVPGVRAATCYDKASARNSREHNHANVLALGGRLLTPGQAEEILRAWLSTPFAGGRYENRVNKISEIERQYSNWNPRTLKNW